MRRRLTDYFKSIENRELREYCAYTVSKLPNISVADVFQTNTLFINFPLDIRGWYREKLVGVYMINDIYVGQSVDMEARIKDHIRKCLKNEHSIVELNASILTNIKFNSHIKIEYMSDNILDEGTVMLEQMFLGKDLKNKVFDGSLKNIRDFIKKYGSINYDLLKSRT